LRLGYPYRNKPSIQHAERSYSAAVRIASDGPIQDVVEIECRAVPRAMTTGVPVGKSAIDLGEEGRRIRRGGEREDYGEDEVKKGKRRSRNRQRKVLRGLQITRAGYGGERLHDVKERRGCNYQHDGVQGRSFSPTRW